MCKTFLNTSHHNLSILWFLVEGPAMKLPLPCPHLSTIASQTITFSTPKSTLTLDGHYPWSLSIESTKRFRTVWARLLVLHLKNIMRLENPSIQPCTTNFHLIKEWCPSRCQSEFGQGTLYFLRFIVWPNLKAAFSGLTRTRLFRILFLWTL